MVGLHKEYQALVKLIASASTTDRSIFVLELSKLFTGRQNVTETVFSNLTKIISAIYDSYLPPEGVESHEFNLLDLEKVRRIT